MKGITLVGLGPGEPDLITRNAWAALSESAEVWVRTPQHPGIAALPSHVRIRSIDNTAVDAHESPRPDDVVVQRVLDLGKRPDGVTYAVPGHPLIGDATCSEIARLAARDGLPLIVVGGLSLYDAVLARPDISASPCLTICGAGSLEGARLPPFPPDLPALITDLETPSATSRTKEILRAIYPADHVVILVSGAALPSHPVERFPLGDLNETLHSQPGLCLYVPPLEKGMSLESLQQVVARLRSPEGCPWDREQTHASLRRHLLEESYEAIAAMDSGEDAAMCEEFGDLLLQIMLNAQIAAELGSFTLNDISKSIYDKIVRRHPHVFGDLELDGVEGVLANWEKMKEGERHGKGTSTGLLAGVPVAMPALSQAQEFQERAARVGFDWPHIEGVLQKVREEIEEVQAATDDHALESELGDLLFALVNVVRWKGVDAESALRASNTRFQKRLQFVEQGARRQDRRLSDLTLEEMDELWNEAKSQE